MPLSNRPTSAPSRGACLLFAALVVASGLASQPASAEAPRTAPAIAAKPVASDPDVISVQSVDESEPFITRVTTTKYRTHRAGGVPAVVGAEIVGSVEFHEGALPAPEAPHPRCGTAETHPCYGDISDITSLPKTKFVNSYVRKDGTPVGSYYKSHREH